MIKKYINIIKNINDEEMEQIINEYNSPIKLKLIIKKHNLPLHSCELYRILPPMILENQKCKYCGGQILVKRASRISPKFPIPNLDEAYCENCHHNPNKEYCNCDNCYSNNIKLIKDTYKIDYNKRIPIKNVSELDKFFVSLLCYNQCDEDYNYIESFNESNIAYSSYFGDNTMIKLIKKLLDDRILLIHPDSKISAFKKDNFPMHPDILKTRFFINIQFNNYDNCELANNIFINKSFIDYSNKNIILFLWKNLAYVECNLYLFTQLQQLKLEDIEFGKKTYDQIHKYLSKLSISQIYALIDESIQNATVQHQHSIMKLIDINYENITNNNFKKLEFSKTKKTHRLLASEYFFNVILNIGDKYFTTVIPNETQLEKFIPQKK